MGEITYVKRFVHLKITVFPIAKRGKQLSVPCLYIALYLTNFSRKNFASLIV